MKIKIPSSLSGVIGGSWNNVLDFSGYTLEERDYLKLEEVSFGTLGNNIKEQTDKIIYNGGILSQIEGILEVGGSTKIIGDIGSAYWVYISGLKEHVVKVKLEFRVVGEKIEARVVEGGWNYDARVSVLYRTRKL